ATRREDNAGHFKTKPKIAIRQPAMVGTVHRRFSSTQYFFDSAWRYINAHLAVDASAKCCDHRRKRAIDIKRYRINALFDAAFRQFFTVHHAAIFPEDFNKLTFNGFGRQGHDLRGIGDDKLVLDNPEATCVDKGRQY